MCLDLCLLTPTPWRPHCTDAQWGHVPLVTFVVVHPIVALRSPHLPHRYRYGVCGMVVVSRPCPIRTQMSSSDRRSALRQWGRITHGAHLVHCAHRPDYVYIEHPTPGPVWATRLECRVWRLRECQPANEGVMVRTWFMDGPIPCTLTQQPICHVRAPVAALSPASHPSGLYMQGFCGQGPHALA